VTFKELRDRTRDLLTFGGWTNTAQTPDYAYLVNRGLKEFTQESQHCVETLSIPTVKNQNLYDARPLAADNRDWVLLFNNASYGTALGWLSQTSLTHLDNMDRLWRFTTASTPTLWFWYNPQTIGVWPTPNVDGVVMQWMGIRYEPLLVNDDDIPLVPDVNCEGIALFAAWYHGKLYARGEELKTVAMYREEAMAQAIRVKEIMAAKNAELTTRYVQRAPQEYMPSGLLQTRTLRGLR
jgi:hypothetical protein